MVGRDGDGRLRIDEGERRRGGEEGAIGRGRHRQRRRSVQRGSGGVKEGTRYLTRRFRLLVELELSSCSTEIDWHGNRSM